MNWAFRKYIYCQFSQYQFSRIWFDSWLGTMALFLKDLHIGSARQHYFPDPNFANWNMEHNAHLSGAETKYVTLLDGVIYIFSPDGERNSENGWTIYEKVY